MKSCSARCAGFKWASNSMLQATLAKQNYPGKPGHSTLSEISKLLRHMTERTKTLSKAYRQPKLGYPINKTYSKDGNNSKHIAKTYSKVEPVEKT